MQVNRNTTSIVLNCNTSVFVDGNVYVFAISSESLVNGIIYNFENEVVQPSPANIADVHCRTSSYTLKSL